MFKGTFKDVVTNIIAVITVLGSIVKVIVDYSATVDLSVMPWYQYLLGVAIALGLYFIGKDSKGKPKVIA